MHNLCRCMCSCMRMPTCVHVHQVGGDARDAPERQQPGHDRPLLPQRPAEALRRAALPFACRGRASLRPPNPNPHAHPTLILTLILTLTLTLGRAPLRPLGSARQGQAGALEVQGARRLAAQGGGRGGARAQRGAAGKGVERHVQTWPREKGATGLFNTEGPPSLYPLTAGDAPEGARAAAAAARAAAGEDRAANPNPNPNPNPTPTPNPNPKARACCAAGLRSRAKTPSC